MIEFKHITAINTAEYDRLLAQGWFRSADFFVKEKFICLENRVATIINIRLPLERYTLRKSHNRTLVRAEKHFTVSIQKASVTPEKEELYNRFKQRFHCFVYKDLRDFLHGAQENMVFDTYEVTVYDNDKLIALSYFDRGRSAIASLLGLYDLNYTRFGLGSYTMLKEVEYARAHSYRYFYPGYILDNLPDYNYKLFLGKMEVLTAKNKWKDLNGTPKKSDELIELLSNTQSIEKLMQQHDINYFKKLNPLFIYSYVPQFSGLLIKSILPVLIPLQAPDRFYLLEYETESGKFIFSKVARAEYYNYLKRFQDNSYYEQDNRYIMDFFEYEYIIKKSSSLAKLIKNELLPRLE